MPSPKGKYKEFKLRLNEEEYKILKEELDHIGICQSEFLRKLLKDYVTDNPDGVSRGNE